MKVAFFFDTPLLCIEGRTHLINAEGKCSTKSGVLKKKVWGERGLRREGGKKKGAENWNKNRLMMELVSR